MSAAASAVDTRWLLLIHQIPPKPDYLRVKIGRRLQRVGAVPVKNSVYVLPDQEGSLEDLQWIRTEIASAGGEAFVCRAEFIDGLTSEQIRHLFRDARKGEYAEIAGRARDLRSEFRLQRGHTRDEVSPVRAADELARLRRRFSAVVALDFFAASERVMAKEALDALEAELSPKQPGGDQARRASHTAPPEHSEHRGRTWVTREGVFVDRMASAWLIRRYVDPGARFRFVREGAYRPASGELRFDMFDGEFTHVGDRCTFEVLLERFAPDDPALRSLAEVVHDIDLRDGKFGREDAAGIERVLAGIVRAHADDAARIDRAAVLFDELRALFASEDAGPQAAASDAPAVE